MLLALLCAAAAPALQEEQAAAVSVVRVARQDEQMALYDADADGRLDVFTIERGGFGVRLLDAAGRYPEQPAAFMPYPGAHLAWDIADLEGDGRARFVVLADGKEVRSYGLGPDGAFTAPEVLLEITSYLPRGVTRMNFVRDVNRDGREDLVVPGAGRYHIFLRTDGAEGSFAAPIDVLFDASIEYEVGDPGSLTSTFGQRVKIPWFSVEDVDGDGRQDLVSETAEEVLFHLADPQLSTSPTWRIDLRALRAQMPRRDGLDLDDLFSNFDGGIDWRIADLDGRAPNDLVLQIGTTFKTYLDATLTGPGDRPNQVLRVSGNLLYFFLRDVTDDGRSDLQLVRGERISIGTVIRWLIFPGSLDFELFTYANEGGSFARRPSRRNKVSIEIPRLVSFLKEIDDLKDEIHRQEAIPARRFAWDDDGADDDVVDLRDGRLLFFRGRAGEQGRAETVYDFEGDFDVLLEQLVLNDLDRQGTAGSPRSTSASSRPGSSRPARSCARGSATRSRTPRIPLPWTGDEMKLQPLDVDGDGRQDLVVVGEERGDQGRFFVVQFVLMR